MLKTETHYEEFNGELHTHKKGELRYEYTITKEGGEAEIMKWSWKKIKFKSLLLKYEKLVDGVPTLINTWTRSSERL